MKFLRCFRSLLFALAVVCATVLIPQVANADVISMIDYGTGWIVGQDSETNEFVAVISTQDGMEDWETEGAKSGLGGFITRIELSKDVTSIDTSLSQYYTKLNTVVISEENADYKAVDNVIYSKDGTELIMYPGGLTDTTYNVPDSVTKIGEYAFAGNSKLTKVSMGEIAEVGKNAFLNCSKLTTLEFDGLNKLSNSSFDGCNLLAEISITNESGTSSYVTDNNFIYTKDKKTLVKCPTGFSGELTLPDSVTKVGSYAFDNTKITEITMPGVTNIGSGAFDKCAELTKVTAGDIDNVDTWAFNACNKLTDFTADSLKSISYNAFYGCGALVNFTIKDASSLKSVGSDAFSKCSSLEEFNYLPEYDSEVFSYCTSLKNITLKSDLTNIPLYLFSNCTALESITIPASVEEIGYEAFESCSSLANIVFEGSTPPEIDSKAFHAIPADAKITVPVESEEAYVAALGEYYRENIMFDGITKYALYVNGLQFRSDRLSIKCGNGMATFIPEKNLLLLNNAEITEGVAYYAYGGCISSGLADLTIQVVGENSINNDYDGICSNRDCNVRIIGDGSLTITTTSPTDLAGSSAMYIGLGSDPTNSTKGSLVIDGPTINTNRQIQANRHITIRNSKVTIKSNEADENNENKQWIRRRIYSNNGGIMMIADDSEVYVDSIGMGCSEEMFASTGSVYSEDMKLELYSGKLTVADGGIYFAVSNAGDDDHRGYVDLKGGQIVITKAAEEGQKLINCPLDNITIADGFNLTAEQLVLGNIDSSAEGTQAPEDTEKPEPVVPVKKVNLNKTTLEMTVGDTETLTYTLEPENATDISITWSSDKSEFASVDKDGKVNAVSAGTAIISVTVQGVSAECLVTVKNKETPTPDPTPDPDPVNKAVTGVKIDNSAISMTEGESKTLSATVEPADATDKTVTWSSSDSSIATVDTTGKVTAVKQGEAVITATAGGKSATCKVTVTAKAVTPVIDDKPSEDSIEVVEKRLLTLSEKDDASSEFGILQAKASKVTKKSVKLSWKKAAGATKYIVYGNLCGSKYKCVKLGEVNKTNFTLSKLNGKALKKGTYYKLIVVALDSNDKVITISKTIHAATSGGKVGNLKKITTKAKKNKVTVKVNKKFKLAGKQVADSKKLKVKNHRKLSYESSDTTIATVTAKGEIKGVKKGSCYVYAYAQNGVSVKIKVTVK